jgi:hypothetical protein
VHGVEGGDKGAVVVEEQGLGVDLHALDPTVALAAAVAGGDGIRAFGP